MTDSEAVEGEGRKILPLDQQFTIIRESFDELSIGLDGPFFKLSQGRYRYRIDTRHDYLIAFGYVFGEASVTITRFGLSFVVDQYVGQNPLDWFRNGALTPDALFLELDTRLHNHSV